MIEVLIQQFEKLHTELNTVCALPDSIYRDPELSTLKDTILTQKCRFQAVASDVEKIRTSKDSDTENNNKRLQIENQSLTTAIAKAKGFRENYLKRKAVIDKRRAALEEKKSEYNRLYTLLIEFRHFESPDYPITRSSTLKTHHLKPIAALQKEATAAKKTLIKAEKRILKTKDNIDTELGKLELLYSDGIAQLKDIQQQIVTLNEALKDKVQVLKAKCQDCFRRYDELKGLCNDAKRYKEIPTYYEDPAVVALVAHLEDKYLTYLEQHHLEITKKYENATRPKAQSKWFDELSCQIDEERAELQRLGHLIKRTSDSLFKKIAAHDKDISTNSEFIIKKIKTTSSVLKTDYIQTQLLLDNLMRALEGLPNTEFLDSIELKLQKHHQTLEEYAKLSNLYRVANLTDQTKYSLLRQFDKLCRYFELNVQKHTRERQAIHLELQTYIKSLKTKHNQEIDTYIELLQGLKRKKSGSFLKNYASCNLSVTENITFADLDTLPLELDTQKFTAEEPSIDDVIEFRRKLHSLARLKRKIERLNDVIDNALHHQATRRNTRAMQLANSLLESINRQLQMEVKIRDHDPRRNKLIALRTLIETHQKSFLELQTTGEYQFISNIAAAIQKEMSDQGLEDLSYDDRCGLIQWIRKYILKPLCDFLKRKQWFGMDDYSLTFFASKSERDISDLIREVANNHTATASFKH